MEQVVIAGSGGSAKDTGRNSNQDQIGLQVYSVQTGTALSSFKRNKTSTNGCAFVKPVISKQRGGRPGYLVCSQVDKPFVHLWKWNKCDVPALRCSAPERLGPMLVDKTGSFLFGGGKTGKVMTWDLNSGELIRLWPGHLRGVTCLVSSDDNAILVSAGEDAVVKVWRMGELVDSSRNAGARIKQLHTLSGHTLPVTGLCIGSCGVDARLVSCSLDHSCKVWSMVTGKLLVSIAFPAALCSVSMDPLERFVFAGGVDGRIFASRISGTDSIKGESPSCFEGHQGAVRGLQVSYDGETLISGSDDGKICFWNIDSLQCFRTIETGLQNVKTLSLAFKQDIVPGSAWKEDTKGSKHSSTLLTIPPLAKYVLETSSSKSSSIKKESQNVDQTLLLARVSPVEQTFPASEQRKMIQTATASSQLAKKIDDDQAFIPMTKSSSKKRKIEEEQEELGTEDDLRKRIQELEKANERYKQVNKELLQQCMSQATA